MLTVALAAGLWLAWSTLAPATAPGSGTLMLIGFALTLTGGLPIGFALALAALIFIWVEGALPGETVIAHILQDKKNFMKARAIRLLHFGGMLAGAILFPLMKSPEIKLFECMRPIPDTLVRIGPRPAGRAHPDGPR